MSRAELKPVVRLAVAVAMLVTLLAPLAAAQGYTWRNVEIVGGGYVPGIVFNPTERDLVYARTDIGGAYRWNEATQRWIPLLDWIGFDDWNLTGVDSLATDPVDPNRLYVLAGTYTNAWTTQNGAVLRSTDRGATFARTNLPFKSGGNMPGRNMGERLAIDPNRNATLYLGARSGNGLWRSTDFGVAWARVTSFPAVGTYVQDPNDPNGYLNDRIGVTWVTFDPRTTGTGGASATIYVGVADLGTSIYRSTDAGATWSALAGQPTGFLPHHGVLGANGILYVTYSNKGGPYDGEKGDVWKFDTATSAWTLISPIPSTSADDYFGYGGLAVDAQDPDTLMVGGAQLVVARHDPLPLDRRGHDLVPHLGVQRVPEPHAALRAGHHRRALARLHRHEPAAAGAVAQARLDGRRHRDRPVRLQPDDVRHGRHHLRRRGPDGLGHRRPDPREGDGAGPRGDGGARPHQPAGGRAAPLRARRHQRLPPRQPDDAARAHDGDAQLRRVEPRLRGAVAVLHRPRRQREPHGEPDRQPRRLLVRRRDQLVPGEQRAARRHRRRHGRGRCERRARRVVAGGCGAALLDDVGQLLDGVRRACRAAPSSSPTA